MHKKALGWMVCAGLMIPISVWAQEMDHSSQGMSAPEASEVAVVELAPKAGAEVSADDTSSQPEVAAPVSRKCGGMGRGGGKEGHGGHEGRRGGGHGGMHRKHKEMVARMDMIEARLAKIEFMLERLLRR